MANYTLKKQRLEVLAKKLKKKNEKAFDELFAMTRDYLFYFIFGIVKDADLADDCLQDTYISVYDKIDSYKESNFLAWMTTIARNKALNAIKKDTRANYIDAQDKEYLMKSNSNEKELVLIKDMKETLDDDEFQIVMMHVIGNYTHKQISNGLGKPLGTITWKYNEAMKKLRSKLEVHYE